MKKETLRKLEYNIARSQTYIEELYPIIHNFFENLLRLDYNFTYNELIEEISNFEDEFGLLFINETKKKKLFDFLEQLIDFEYNKKDHTQKEIKALFREFMDIVKEYTELRKEKNEKKTKSFFGLFDKKEKEEKKEEEKPIIDIQEQAMEDVIEENESDDKNLIEKKEPTELKEEEKLQELEVSLKEQFDNVLKETKDALAQNNHGDTKRLYHHLREIFIELPENEKKEYKKELWEIYNKLNKK